MTVKRGTQEQYLSARNASSLRLVVNNTGPADMLVAAGLVAKRSERKTVALAVWGVLATEQMRGANLVSELMAGWIRKRSYQLDDRVMAPVQAKDLAMTVLKWFRSPACPACGGHGHPKITNSPVIDESRQCGECHGTGRIPLSRLMKPEVVDHARWLANEIEVLTAMVAGEIRRELNRD